MKKLIVIALLLGSTILAEFNQDVLTLGPLDQKYNLDKVEAGQYIDTKSGEKVELISIIDKKTNIFVIGESHTNYDCHAFQRDFIEALYNQNPNIVVGFEFFNREHNAILEKWRLGEISEEELLKETGWYTRKSFNYGYTKMIMDFIQKHQIKVIGLNVSRDILRTISRQGFEQLSKEDQNLFPTINIPNPEHEYFIKGIFGDFAVNNPDKFTNIYTAQKCWDVVMAESMREFLNQKEYKNHTGVIIAGSNHVAYKLGIPFRYNKANKKTNITTIMPVLVEEAEESDENPMAKMTKKIDPHGMPGMSQNPSSTFSRGIADIVFGAKELKQEYFADFGATVKEEEGMIVVSKINDDSPALKNGLAEGDQILAIDGVEITSVEQFYTIVAAKNWDDELEIKINKKVTF
ncbi:MAG: ChaN family lipoprotein [Candidatus Marinimicrobia bacterium]|nr:ChaN family lipoprotein [Candidatus Neomarinimicrobiota bacterium]